MKVRVTKFKNFEISARGGGVTTIYESTGCAIFWGAFFRVENNFWGIIFGKIASIHKFWGVILEKNCLEY